MSKQIKKHGKTAFVIGVTIALLGAYISIPQSNAVAITDREVQITDSRPGVTTDYDFEGDFSTTNISCIEVIFCANATGACGEATGIDASSATTLAAGWANWFSANFTASNFTASRIMFTTDTATPGGNDFSFAVQGVVNPTSTAAATYFGRLTTYATGASCAGTTVDTGIVAFAIIDGVEITATVAETLTFAIGSVSVGDCNTSFETEAGPSTSTASAVAFGELSLNTFTHACQNITVSTNAVGGYTVRVHETTSLLDGAATIDDATGEGGMTDTTTSLWETNTNSGFAYSCNDENGSDCVITSASMYRRFACVGSNAQCDPTTGLASAVAYMTNTGPANAANGRIEYKVSVGATQEAGSYSNEIVFVATPTF